MEVSNYSQQQKVRERQRELETKEQELLAAKIKAQKDAEADIQAEKDRASKDIVNISKESESIASTMRQQNSNYVQQTEKNSQEKMQKMAETTANRLKEIDSDHQKRLINAQKSSMELIDDMNTKAQDAFYRPHTFEAVVNRVPEGYAIEIPIAAHEAENLFVTTEGRSVRLSLARTFESTQPTSENTKNRTQSRQSVTETIQLPELLNGKSIKREYVDGTLSIKINRA